VLMNVLEVGHVGAVAVGGGWCVYDFAWKVG